MAPKRPLDRKEAPRERSRKLPVVTEDGYSPVAHGARCDICPLRGNPVVPPKAAQLPARAVFVGEAPGRKEELFGEPFIGRTGVFLKGLLREVDIDIREIALTNGALCRSEIDRENDEAAICCAPRLLKELAQFDPSIPIVTFGKTSTLSVLGVRSILNARGFVWTAREIDALSAWREAKRAKTRGAPKWRELWLKAQIYEGRAMLAGRTVLPTVHPAFVLRSDTWRPILHIDLDRIGRWIRGELTREKLVDNGQYTVVTKKADVLRELSKLKPVISVDIETGASESGKDDGADPNRNRVLCVGISDGKRTLVVWPWKVRTHRPLLRKFFKSKRVHKIGMHNGYNFDQISLSRNGIPFEEIDDKLEDTLIAHHTFASHMPQRLSHVASVFLDCSPWKITFKKGKDGASEKGIPPEKLDPKDLCLYNCLPGRTRVLLADGSVRSLSLIVKRRERPMVLAYSPDEGIVARRVVGWSCTRVVGQKWWAVTTAARPDTRRRLVSTPDHKLYLRRGWVEASNVRVGDELALPERRMSAEQRDALLGSLLGDSSLYTSPSWRKRKQWPVAAVTGGHTDSAGLAQAKARALPDLIVCAKNIQIGGGYPNAQPSRRYSTAMRHDVVEFKALYDRNGKKRLTVATLDQLGPIGFAWWFADDGCRAANAVRLATNGFPASDIRRAADWFTKKFGYTSIVNGGVLALGKEATGHFCTLIAPYLFPCVRYKLPTDRVWPAYVDRVFESDGQPTFSRVTSSRSFSPTGPWWHAHSGAHRRYCLTVEKDHNFFTVNGLVANSADARIQARVWLEMQNDLEDERAVYEVDKENARLCRGLIIDGIGVDLKRRAELRDGMIAKEADLLEKMRTLLKRKTFHPMQLNEVRRALFTTLRAPIEIADPTGTGLPSTSAKTLERLKENPTRAGRFADYLLQWRGVVKIRGTYLESQVLDAPVEYWPDFAWTHFNWKSYGAASGRYSGRLQSCPRAEYLKDKSIVLETRVREMYCAPPGHKFVYFDLCFAAGTLIDGPMGPKPIERMRIGDPVYTYRETTRRPAIGKVVEKVRVGRQPVLKVTLDNGEVVRCTPEHKWIVVPPAPRRHAKGPTPRGAPVDRLARDLKPGDRLLPLKKQCIQGREHLYAHDAFTYSKTHVEVAATFYGPRPEGHDVHHLDENPTNNDPENLEYKQARKHKSEHGKTHAREQWRDPAIRARMTAGLKRAAATRPGWCVGENNPRFGDRRQRRTRPCDFCGKTIEFYASADKRFCGRKCYGAARRMGLNHRVVSVEQDGYADVWSIGVDPDRNYALAAGVFVRNSQAELRFAAYLSGDPAFIAACESGDVHTATAQKLFPAEAELIGRDPKGVGKPFRDVEKNSIFGFIYWADPSTIFIFVRSKGLPVELRDVLSMHDMVHETFHVYFRWCEQNKRLVEKCGHWRDALSGRISWLGWKPGISDTANRPVQGGIASLMNVRLPQIRARLPKSVIGKNGVLKYSGVVAQVHDAAILCVPDEYVDQVKQIVQVTWAQPVVIPAGGRYGGSLKLEEGARQFVMPIDLKVGERWSSFG